ncbi:MAG: leucine-rich repeat domain-containing protein [Bacteroidaceae bacterium]|nr:leucine-rich repeat domain-containing protein [Bacteroidaceae bacterium]
MKRHLLLLLVALLPILANAYDAKIDGIYYDFSGDEAIVTYESEGFNSYSGTVAIPESVTYSGKTYRVTSIREYAFYGCSSLSSVTILEGVTSIGDMAFYECSSLTSITIPESVTSIGDYAFNGTAWYDNLPDGLLYAGKVAYKYMGAMPDGTEITLKDGTSQIADYAFRDCSSLTSITIPSSVTSISRGAFSGCTGLTSITIPNSVTSIGDGTFYNCTSLRSINIPESVTSIGDKVFQDCNKLSSVIINCPIVGSWFSHKSSITEFFLGKNVTNIEENAFSDCSGLTTVTIGSSVTTIGDDAFENCYRLTTIYCLNPVPPTCAGLETFVCGNKYVRDIYDVYNYATLHVPMGSKEAYSSAYEWRYFNKIKEDMEMNGQMYYTTLSVNQAGDGYVKHYVKADEPYTLFIGSEVGMRINTVMFNGEDVTDRLVDGYYTTPVITRPSKIFVSFELDPDGISYTPADDNLHVYGTEGSLYVSGLAEPQGMSVYTLDGKLTSTQTIEGDTKLKLNEGIYIIKVGERTFKVQL